MNENNLQLLQLYVIVLPPRKLTYKSHQKTTKQKNSFAFNKYLTQQTIYVLLIIKFQNKTKQFNTNLFGSEHDEFSPLGDRALLHVHLVGQGDRGRARESDSGEDASSLLEGRPNARFFCIGQPIPQTASGHTADHRHKLDGTSKPKLEVKKKDFLS